MEDRLRRYRDLVLEKNQVLNLTAITDEREFDQRNIEDSLKIREYHSFSRGERVMDLGTGAGLPGIPLAIAEPWIHLTLVDARKKKVAFLTQLIKELEINNAVAIAGRAEDLGRDLSHRAHYDTVLTRALAPLRVLLEYSIPFLKVGGKLVAYKGPKATEELLEAKEALKRLHTKLIGIHHYEMMGATLSLVFFEKTKKTPEEFPRQPGTPSKKPL